jgi:hypothetical protein
MVALTSKCPILGLKKSSSTVVNALHPDGVRICFELSRVNVFGPVLLQSTVTPDVYHSLLSDEIIRFLTGYGISINLTFSRRWRQTSYYQRHTSLFFVASSRKYAFELLFYAT